MNTTGRWPAAVSALLLAAALVACAAAPCAPPAAASGVCSCSAGCACGGNSPCGAGCAPSTCECDCGDCGPGSGYELPSGGGGVTTSYYCNDRTIHFGHGGRHLEGTSLSISYVEQAIAEDVSLREYTMGSYGDLEINVLGVQIVYRAFGIGNSTINVGTYFPSG